MRTTAWWVLAGLAVLIAAILVFLVPWAPTPPRSEQLAALGELPADKVARAREFHTALRPGSYGALLLGLALSVVLGLTPLGARLIGLLPAHWLVRGVLGGLLLVTLAQLLTLPVAAWQETILRRYGLSTRDWGSWGGDVLKGYLLSAVLSAVALGAFYTLVRYAPRWWWAFGAAGAALVVVLLSFALPVLVEPVFNKFVPLSEGPLRSTLMELAARDGVPVKDVLIADASRRTRAVNAYVSGLGPTRRIVVYDTLLKEAPPEEVAAVVAHELGHAKDNDVLLGTVTGALGAAAGVVGLYLLGGWTGLLRRAGVDAVTDPRALALLFAVAGIVGLLAGPVQNLVSRQVEARADRHALALTGDPDTFGAMQRRLSLVNLGDPDPPAPEYLLFSSHPSAVQRMAVARTWKKP
ncbi:M48 family metallopeptidase [Longispora sp. NPDC051575]|uniref:M48 family metallopeptidase n=1 Tax=Longispora sp. NPDC051575 TaxID=3154943 RepID=UPI003441A4A8